VDWRDRITIDPAVCHGEAVIRGTRIQVSVVLDNLAAGTDQATLLGNYPALRSEDIHAALAYAADLAHERTLPLPKTA
jgi:uncharacterized protein (DUF433 family)